MRISPFGDRAYLLELEQRIDPAIVIAARALAHAWEARGLGRAIPAYASVVLGFDPDRTSPAEALAAARDLGERPPPPDRATPARLIEIPTIYDGADLADVAERSAMRVDELVALHTGRQYDVFFIGFMPGFAYCGRLDPRIVAPRLAAPRARVPAGSVAVADGQTAVYPFASPGGWRLLGRTEVAMFDLAADPPSRLQAGDRVRFVAR